ncbi:hypothetical protein [Tsukamurella sp. PLM1]
MTRTIAHVVAEQGAAPSDLEVEVPDPIGHRCSCGFTRSGCVTPT